MLGECDITARDTGPDFLNANAQRFRESMGFSTDPALLATMSMTITSQQKYGVPLTRAEEADIDARITLQESLLPLVDFANAHDDVMGGVWLDQTATHGHGAMINVALTDRADQRLVAQAAALIPAGVAVAYPKVNRSLGELWNTFADVERTVSAPAHTAFELIGYHLDVPSNRIEVVVADGGQGEAAAQFGPSVLVNVGVPLRPTSCVPAARCTFLPYRGGLQILDPHPQFYQCTSGYWAKQPQSGNFYIITAAHCDAAPASIDAYRNDLTQHLGLWNADSISGIGCGSTCPANTETYRVLIDSGLVPGSGRNCVYESAGLTCRTITTTAIWSNIVTGTVVCMAGVTSSVKCGHVTSIGSGVVPEDRYPAPANVSKGIYTDFVAGLGDSGGPEYSGSTAYGIIAAIGGGKTFASSVQWALTDLGLSLCTTSTCPQ